MPERTDVSLTQNQLIELLESEHVKALVERAEERGFIEPPSSKPSARARPRRRGGRAALARARDVGLEVGQPPQDGPRRREGRRGPAADAPVAPGAADSLQLFLADVGRHKLLTAAEEVTLAKRSSAATRRQAPR